MSERIWEELRFRKMATDREAWKRFVELAKTQRVVAPREDLKIDPPSEFRL